MIDWVDSIKLNDISYLRIQAVIAKADLAEPIGTVKFKLSENVHDPNYKTKNGDAAFLEPGTPIYRLKNYKPSFRVGVQSGNSIAVYEVSQNPKAQSGADLFDISDKVSSIGINNEQDNSEIVRITDPQKIHQLVQLVQDAKVESNYSAKSGKRYFIAFYLNDGSVLNRAFWPETHEIWPEILLPSEFTQIVLQAVGEK